MLVNQSPIFQAFLGTFFTWGVTAAGAAMVIFFKGTQRKILDCSLGFAAGVMVAASYWSLLSPAIEQAEESGSYGKSGQWAFIPVAIGFLMGAFFVYLTDVLLSKFGLHTPQLLLATNGGTKMIKEKADFDTNHYYTTTIDGFQDLASSSSSHVGSANLLRRKGPTSNSEVPSTPEEEQKVDQYHKQWKRILLLIVAVTVHNIPEGLAVGVGFAAVGSSPSATFERARNLALGIGIQNFPEGLAVSLPLRASGFSLARSFWYGQLSGIVEPIFGVLGALAVGAAQPLLPYALAFAAGAMIYVVVDDIIPEAHASGHGKLASWGAIFGFIVMMVLDVALG